MTIRRGSGRSAVRSGSAAKKGGSQKVRLRGEANGLSIALERLRQMKQLYRNWPTAFADRAGVLSDRSFVVYRLATDSGEAALIAATNRWDVKVINEIWTGRFYDRLVPPPLREKRGLTVVDIGANRGYFSVYAAKVFDVARILAVEPDADNASILRANLELNGVREASVRQAAVLGSDEKEAQLYSATLPGLHTTVSPSMAARFGLTCDRYAGHSRKVPAVHIDDVLREAAGEDGRVDIVKIDIEGLEEVLLESVDLALLGTVNYVVAETETPVSTRVIYRLEEAGFRVEERPWMIYGVQQ